MLNFGESQRSLDKKPNDNNVEVNFSSMTTDTDKIKAKQKHLISQIDARMQSRFMKGNKLPTLNILASSKNSDQSFLETYIDMKKEHESKTTLVIDEPQWVIRNDKDSPQKFYVAIGSKFLASEVLPLDATEELANEYRDKGYQLLRVPSGYYEAFKDNVDLALTDIAGISTVNALKYISGEKLKQIKTPSYRNPFTKDIIEVGTNDTFQYSDFFDMSVISSEDKYRPMYIHLDMSISGDKTGIAGVWIAGKRGSEVYYKVAFSVSIKAPKGYEISFEKNRNFIRWLKEMGFAIKGISCDTFQSAQIQQQLTADGFDVKVVSVDRLETASGTKHKVCLPYAYFQSSIYEKRLSLYDKCDLLTDEILGLERESDGHINHPNGGTQGCFTGDTKVSLVDGRELSFFELVDEFNSGKTNFVYSFNGTTKRIEAKKILNAWCTNPSSELVEVTLDNGEKLRCTPNHRFMLRDGSYCEAKDLLENEQLMPNGNKGIGVASVKPLSYKEPVYDITVEDNHNFALTAGVFVHNSKDQCDAVVGALWNASQNVDKYAYDYGETLDIIEKVNSSQDDALRKQISVSMEEELAKIVDPIRKTTPPVTTPKQQAEENKFRDYMNAYNGFVVF